MKLFKIEYRFHFKGNQATIYRRLVTPFFFLNLKPKLAFHIKIKSRVGFVPSPFFPLFFDVPEGYLRVHHFWEWDSGKMCSENWKERLGKYKPCLHKIIKEENLDAN